jgi:hypothetical protein
MIKWSTAVACSAQLLMCCLGAHSAARVMAVLVRHLEVLLLLQLQSAVLLPLLLTLLRSLCAVIGQCDSSFT